jgi:hypothetical protein
MGFIATYDTLVRPIEAARKREHANEQRIVELLRRSGARWERRALFPYRMASGFQLFEHVIRRCEESECDTLIMDTTCFTKIHAVALAEWLMGREPASKVRLVVASTRPHQYGLQSHGWRRAEYRDIVFAPVGETLESVARKDWRSLVDVIALVGHEGARLKMALSLIEVDQGLAVIPQPDNGSDAGVIGRLENADFLSDARAGRNGSWQLAEVERGEVELLHGLVTDFIKRSRADRVVVVPLGPKPLIIQSMASALFAQRRRIWVSYPVPQSYNLTYSSGAGATDYFELLWDRA